MEDNKELLCLICKYSDSDDLVFGEWMSVRNLQVHYFCLLLSTHLPQRGGDCSGILGFLLRDIREEAAAAEKRICWYCNKIGASLQCDRCRTLFHLKCGLENRAVFEFCGQYKSYCYRCRPMDDYKQQVHNNPPRNYTCPICFSSIYKVELHCVVYGDCCRRGFAHKKCMRQYALTSGYYLRCIWCRSESFRDSIRLQSVFVPDRDATWEKQRNAYRELHERNVKCDQPNCLCPNGRTYNRLSWVIISCTSCAATSAHLKCLVGTLRLPKKHERTDFKCAMCLDVEKRIAERPTRNTEKNHAESDNQVDSSFYVQKFGPDAATRSLTQTPVFSEDESERSSNITVIFSQSKPIETSERLSLSPPPEDLIVEIPDSPQTSPQPSIDEPHSPPPTASNESSCPPQPTAINEMPDSPQPVSRTPECKQAPCVSQISDSPQLQEQAVTEAFKSPPVPKEDPNSLLVLKSGFRCPDEPFFYLVIYEFEQGTCMGECTGTCVLRFKDNDPRIQDTSQAALERLKITSDDVWCRSEERGVFEYIKKFHEWYGSEGFS
ncbi:uncharacterized protein LOC6543380 [Drosophila erecta]|uniref:PHD-type domain-containing protein n=1 Tax=Drosophila erecta TaxID=7220 RepID=B3N9P7_DROER|nr:uncharacterized protein LOC6543380 [Drosophila erecta]EDV58542.1 uncharacterized protein Dere_GG23932 [Drosophila erecta]